MKCLQGFRWGIWMAWTLTVVAWIAVPLSLAAEPQAKDQEPQLVKVYFERQVEPELLQRYEILTTNIYLEKKPTDEEILKKVTKYRQDEYFIYLALYLDPTDRAYFWKSKVRGKDRIREAERDK